MAASFSVNIQGLRAPRSKGCITCRQRKVRCDERRPTCHRCEKASRACLGYDKPLIIIHQSPGSRDESTRQSHSRSSDDDMTLSTKVLPCDVGRADSYLDLHGFKDEIVISHFLSNFIIGFRDNLPLGADAPTMVTILNSGGTSGAYMSGLGLAQAFFGRIHKVDSMVLESATLYGRALVSLRGDLQLTAQAKSHAYMNLWTSLFLGLYEMVCSAESSNWLQHSMGVSTLTQMVGPEGFQSRTANAMLEMCRSFIAVAHIAQRRRCFLEQEQWLTVPWANDPSRPIGSRLCDLLCHVPGLMEDLDSIMAEAETSNMSIERGILQDKIVDMIHRLADLRWLWEAMYPLACTEVPLTPWSVVADDDQGPLFETSFEFENMDRAMDVLYFNAVRLMLYTLSDQVGLTEEAIAGVRSQRDGPISNPLLLPGVRGDRVANALEICHTAEYLMRAGRSSQGILALLFPLRVAYTHVQGLPRIAGWIRRVLGASSTLGFKLGEHVLNLQSRRVISN